MPRTDYGPTVRRAKRYLAKPFHDREPQDRHPAPSRLPRLPWLVVQSA